MLLFISASILSLAFHALSVFLAGHYIIVLSRACLAGIRAARDPMNRLTLLGPWYFFYRHYGREIVKLRSGLPYLVAGILYGFFLILALMLFMALYPRSPAPFAIIFPIHY